jgi:hypothetical protein
MLTRAQIETRTHAIDQVSEFLDQRPRLSVEDLIEIGGEDLRKSVPAKLRAKALRVERCWSLMASLGVKYADLESSNHPIKSSEGRQAGGRF